VIVISDSGPKRNADVGERLDRAAAGTRRDVDDKHAREKVDSGAKRDADRLKK
jgi:hypothetical protein